ncbi:threonylcarbamoyl-AMP synthase [Patescibacteria group bacterium]|nr:threonylcarbamoyl-AMP synthase [Patescibacteria group bacterium]
MDEVQKAAEIINDGGVVIFPTDTVFGIGCRIGNQKAIERLYRIKERNEGKPTLIMIENIKQGRKYAKFDKRSLLLAKAFWPGPLTLVLKSKEGVPNMIKGIQNTVGIREPNHKIVQKLISLVGEPILAPSANFSRQVPPSKFSKIDKNLIKLVDYVLNFECGGDKPSTIFESLDGTSNFIRIGAISKSRILNKLSLLM